MIRAITEADAPTVADLAVSSGLFSDSEVGIVQGMMSDYFARTRDTGHVCLIDDDDKPNGVAYYEPATATDGTWYLTMIAVRRDGQGAGRGTAMLAEVESRLRADGQRLLLVETSGVPGFALTRGFYAKCHYTEEARVRDYYEPGDDMVLFRKDLTA